MPAKKRIYKSLKNGTTDDDGKKVDGPISHEEQLTYEKICNLFDMKNMSDFHNHYLKKNALLLADIFENFVDTYVKFYGLDSCHYFSSPGLTSDAMLKMNGVKLEKYLILASTYLLKKD